MSTNNYKEKYLIKRKKIRAPNRIDPIMKRLTELWKQHPDWRLCQLLGNIAKEISWKSNDLFYLEDNELLKGLSRSETGSKHHD